MSKVNGFNLLKKKVPEFRDPLKTIIIITVAILAFLIIIFFFCWFDSLFWYGAIISQLILSIITSIFFYGFTTKAEIYRRKYGEYAYRNFFFHFVIPVLITGNAGIFHSLLIDGPSLFPFLLASIIGIFFIIVRFLLEWHLHKAGFNEIAHGLGIYMIFPEEGFSVNSNIYSHIRHPMYTGDLFMAIGLALLKNNLLSIIIALISFIPFVIGARMEDKELINRFGEEHLNYIKRTPAFFPYHKKIIKFMRFLFSTGENYKKLSL